MNALMVAVTAVAASFLAALGHGFGPWPADNIMLSSEILGLPVWLECFVLAGALALVCIVSATRMIRHTKQDGRLS